MMDNDEIETVYPSQPDPNLPLNKQAQRYFLGKRVIVDDSMPVVAGGVSGYVYTSVLFGEGVIGFGERTPVGPSFITREELQGNGAGVEIIGERKSWCIHPFGFAFTSAAIAPGTHGPSLAELANVANWDRRIERKNVPLAFLKTNG
jgi:hypothetical protein